MKLLRHFLTTLYCLVIGSSVQAAGFNTPQSGASYTAQGQGGITFFDNAGLVAQNPAAMIKLEAGSHFYGGAAQYQTNYTYEDLNGNNKAETVHSASVVPHFYGLYNSKDWAAGTGIYFPFNNGLEWPDSWFGSQVLTKLRLATMNLPIVGAYSFGEYSVGGGLNFITAEVILENYAIRYEDPNNPTVNLDVKANLEGKGTTTGWNASALYDGGNIAAALAYNAAFTINGEGDATFDISNPAILNALIAGGAAPSFPNGNISVDINYPALVEVAGSYKSFTSGDGYQAGAYAIEAGLLHAGWSAFDKIVIEYDNKLPASETVLDQNWKDVVDYKIGGFYSATDYTKIRGGYYKTASPIPESTLAPTTPDGSGRNSLFLGAGYKQKAFLIDFAYLVSDFLPSETRTNPKLTGKYDGDATVLQLSAGYSF